MVVECLSCGLPRDVTGDAGECPRCRYLGWAPAEDVGEPLRRRLRERPVASRRLVALGRRERRDEGVRSLPAA